MLPSVADFINACIEFAAAFFILFSVRKLHTDKLVRGVSWVQIAFFTWLGVWNLFYFQAIGSPWSFWAGVVILAVNATYLGMILFYLWAEKHTPKRGANLFIETWSGQPFYALDPDAKAVRVDDIGHALGNICRYMGHTDGPNNGFYSVAEHCCLMSDWVLAQGWGVEKAFAAHIHDAGEPYAGDQPRPWKVAVPILKQLEQDIDNVVLPAIGGSAIKPKWLEEIDSRIIMDERAQARRPSDNVWFTHDLEPLGVTLQFWTPAQATTQWMRRYNDLSHAMAVHVSGGSDAV